MEDLLWIPQHIHNSISIVFVYSAAKQKMDTSQLYSTTSCGPAMGDQNQGSTSSNAGGGGRRRRRRRRSREIETLSLEIRNYPRDLLQTFISTDRNTPRKQQSAMEEQGEEDEDLELNLGLSLGGRFGVDKSHRGLIRSSSIAGAIPCLREGGEEEKEEASVAPPAELARTSSLPTVTEDEWRRRKATLRRMEAKRRRSEKQRSVMESGGAGEERESGLGLSFRGRLEREQQHLGTPGKLNPGPGPVWPGPVKAKGGFFRSLQGLLAHQQQQLKGCSQGSGESQGGSSSAASELENRTHQGCGSGGEAKSRGSSQSMQMQERGSQEAGMGSSSSKPAEASDHRKKEAGGSGMEDMPSVFTIGDGPSGRKVEGILYRYGRGEGVRIMCVCHGSFFSPAEFVMHAGGSDVDHPLRHIVVNPSSSPFA